MDAVCFSVAWPIFPSAHSCNTSLNFREILTHISGPGMHETGQMDQLKCGNHNPTNIFDSNASTELSIQTSSRATTKSHVFVHNGVVRSCVWVSVTPFPNLFTYTVCAVDGMVVAQENLPPRTSPTGRIMIFTSVTVALIIPWAWDYLQWSRLYYIWFIDRKINQSDDYRVRWEWRPVPRIRSNIVGALGQTWSNPIGCDQSYSFRDENALLQGGITNHPR